MAAEPRTAALTLLLQKHANDPVGVGSRLRLSSASSDGKRVVMKRDMSHGDVNEAAVAKNRPK